MKNRVLTTAIKSIAIVLMLLSAVAVAFPLMNFINGKLYQVESHVLSQLQEKTGLSFSYGSLSPAILTGLNFKNIDVYDAETDSILLHLDSVTVGYRLWPLIHGNITEAIGGVTVNGLTFRFNDTKNMDVLKRILSLSGGTDSDDDGAGGFFMPFPVSLRNCSFQIEVEGMSGTLLLDSLSLKSSSSSKRTTSIETEGNLSFIPDNTLTHIIPVLTADMKVQAILTPDLNGTFGRFELKKADGGTFAFKDAEFAAGFQDRKLTLSVFTPDAPYGIEALWDMEKGTIHAELNAERFDPFTVVSLKTKDKLADKLAGAEIDGKFCFDMKLPSEEGKSPAISYDAAGSVSLPPGLLKDGIRVSADADGNLNRVNVTKLSVEATPFSGTYSGIVNVSTLSLSGYLWLEHYQLPSGKNLEGEFYIEDLPYGFSAFCPQLMIGDAALTAVQIECVPDRQSADISFEAYDYSHLEADEPGLITLDGSLLYGEERFLQASLGLENEYLDSLLRYADNALPEESGFDPDLIERVSPYILSCEAYGSTDFSTLSFNVPYVIAANTVKNGEMLLLSMDGNETTAQISQLELVYAGQQLSAVINADADEDYSQVFFSADFTFNEMPYYFSGAYTAGKEIVVNGDYDFELRFDLRVKKEILCSVNVDSIPVKISDYLFSVSLDSEIEYSNLEKFWITLNRFEVSESSGKLRINPRIDMTGYADRYGLMLEQIDYGDSVSILSGSGAFSWNLTETTLDSVSVNIQLENPIGGEQVNVDVSCSNPEGIPFDEADLFKELYVSGSVDVNGLYMSRFLEHQQNEDRLTVHGTLLGQLDNPFVALEVPGVNMHAGGTPLSASAYLMLDDRILSGNSISFKYGGSSAQDFAFDLSLEEMSGSGSGQFNIDMAPLFSGNSPVHFSFALDQNESGKYELDFKKSGYEASLVFDEITSDDGKVIKDYGIYVRHDEGMWYLTAGTESGISGFLLDSGEFYLSVIEDFPITFTADGSLKDSSLDIQVTGINGNLSTFRPLFGNTFYIADGAFEGDLHLGGTTSDPDFTGSLSVADMRVELPDYISEPMIAPVAVINAEGSSFLADKVLFNVGKGKALVDLDVEMDRWSLESLDVRIQSANGSLLPGRFNFSYGDCTADCDMILNFNMTGDDMTVTGELNCINGIVELHSDNSDSDDSSDSDDDGRMYVDLSISINQKAELYYPDKENPLIRGLVTTQQPIRIIMDSDEAEINVTGSLVMRGGEILYLNRNFYMREGSVELDGTGGEFDPRISFRAEVRERDAEGELVKITLSAERQKLSELSPSLSSDPAKTEDEIRMLLGAALIAESGSTPGEVLASVAASGFDFLLQNSLFRQLENRLRDLCNFDIFSFRTPFIQQALLQAMNNSEEPVSLGNFFDNTTVYIGKYIGNTIYLDALLRFVYQDGSSGKKGSQRLVLQPEIGLELPSPFATIRWSIAPDISSARNLWVPYTSISLSWRFQF